MRGTKKKSLRFSSSVFSRPFNITFQCTLILVLLSFYPYLITSDISEDVDDVQVNPYLLSDLTPKKGEAEDKAPIPDHPKDPYDYDDNEEYDDSLPLNGLNPITESDGNENEKEEEDIYDEDPNDTFYSSNQEDYQSREKSDSQDDIYGNQYDDLQDQGEYDYKDAEFDNEHQIQPPPPPPPETLKERRARLRNKRKNRKPKKDQDTPEPQQSQAIPYQQDQSASKPNIPFYQSEQIYPNTRLELLQRENQLLLRHLLAPPAHPTNAQFPRCQDDSGCQYSGPIGGFGGITFEDQYLKDYRISKIVLHHAVVVDGFQVHLSPISGNGPDVVNENHGTESGNTGVFEIPVGNYLYQVEGFHDTKLIRALRFRTRGTKGDVVSQWYGSIQGEFLRFRLSAGKGRDIKGFIGATGLYIDCLGIFTSMLPVSPVSHFQGMCKNNLQTSTRGHQEEDLSQNLVKVMSFNIRYDNTEDALDSRYSWQLRKQKMAELILRHRPHVFGVQEALEPQIRSLMGLLGSVYSYVGVGRTDGATSGEFSAIFYQKSYFELKKSETVWLSDTPYTVGSRGWDGVLERICTWALFTIKHSQEKLLILNTHFDHEGSVARMQSSELILRLAQQISDNEREKIPMLVMGDFNSEIDSHEYQIVLGECGCEKHPYYPADLSLYSDSDVDAYLDNDEELSPLKIKYATNEDGEVEMNVERLDDNNDVEVSLGSEEDLAQEEEKRKAEAWKRKEEREKERERKKEEKEKERAQRREQELRDIVIHPLADWRIPPKFRLRDAVMDAWTGLYGPPGTFIAYRLLPTEPYVPKVIDFLFVNDHVFVWHASVITDHWDFLLPSDHRPVMVEVLLVSKNNCENRRRSDNYVGRLGDRDFSELELQADDFEASSWSFGWIEIVVLGSLAGMCLFSWKKIYRFVHQWSTAKKTH